MFVNNIPFLITMSRKIKFITVEHIPTRTAKQLSKGLKRVMRLYSRAGTFLREMQRHIEVLYNLPKVGGMKTSVTRFTI